VIEHGRTALDASREQLMDDPKFSIKFARIGIADTSNVQLSKGTANETS